MTKAGILAAVNIDGRAYRTLWPDEARTAVFVIDQTRLPHQLQVVRLASHGEVAHAIRTMQVRGAPLIGVSAAYGLALALAADASDDRIVAVHRELLETRPTAVNLRWALDRMKSLLLSVPTIERRELAWREASAIAEEDVANCREIGRHGLRLLRDLANEKSGGVVQVLTHCNAGWLACVDWGTALAPVYAAFDEGIPIHVWVDETRPRNQGASLTSYELGAHGVPHTVIVDNAGGHLMQHGEVDICFVGSDRTTARGDVANKIGTYLKALAAKDNGVPFYAAVPASTIDWSLEDGIADIPIEDRGPDEVLAMTGALPDGSFATVSLARAGTRARNPGFDVTPARLLSGIITERGIASANRADLMRLFPGGAR